MGHGSRYSGAGICDCRELPTRCGHRSSAPFPPSRTQMRLLADEEKEKQRNFWIAWQPDETSDIWSQGQQVTHLAGYVLQRNAAHCVEVDASPNDGTKRMAPSRFGCCVGKEYWSGDGKPEDAAEVRQPKAGIRVMAAFGLPGQKTRRRQGDLRKLVCIADHRWGSQDGWLKFADQPVMVRAGGRIIRRGISRSRTGHPCFSSIMVMTRTPPHKSGVGVCHYGVSKHQI